MVENLHASSMHFANIYCGLKESYDGFIHKVQEVEKLLEQYCNDNGCGLTVTETKFIYKNGKEPGVIVGLINYPRYPCTAIDLQDCAIDIARILKNGFRQERVTVVTNTLTLMLGNK